MSWTCSCDTQNLDATRYCEFCGAERQSHAPTRAEGGTGSGMQWSPPVPRFTEEPWRHGPRYAELPPDIAAEIEALKAKLATRPDGHVTRVDPAAEARYLAACRDRRAVPAAWITEDAGP